MNFYLVSFDDKENPRILFSEGFYPRLHVSEIGDFQNRLLFIPNDTCFECYTTSTYIKETLDRNTLLKYMLSAEQRAPGTKSYEYVQDSDRLQRMRFEVNY